MATINANFGTFEYREGGVIAIPLTFPADVIVPSKSVCQITPVSNSDLTGVSHRIIGKGRAFEVVVAVPTNREGSFSVDITGTVLNVSTGVWDTVSVDSVSVPYSTVVPELVDHRVVRTGERIDVILQYDTDCTLADPIAEFGTMAQRADFLDYAGQDLDPPNFYRKIDNTYPTLPLPDTLPIAEWAQADVQTEDATIYLLRWGSVPETEDFNVTIKAGFVRGPVN